MAKKKSRKKGRKSGRRHNPKGGRHHHHGRRRRNPDTFGSRLGRLTGMGFTAVGTGVLVYLVQGQIQTTHPNVAMFVPAAGLALGAAIARKAPMVGVGVGVGAVATLAVPVAAKVLSALSPTPPSTTTTAALGRAARMLRAVDMAGYRMGSRIHGLGAVDMAAVDLRG